MVSDHVIPDSCPDCGNLDLQKDITPYTAIGSPYMAGEYTVYCDNCNHIFDDGEY